MSKKFFIFPQNRTSNPLYKKNMIFFRFSHFLKNRNSGPLYKKMKKCFVFFLNRNSDLTL